MAKRILILSFLVLILVLPSAVLPAQESRQAGDEKGMPVMGPPDEIKEMDWIIGIWDVEMKSRFDLQDTNWVHSIGQAKYEWIAGGGALMMTFDSDMMGIPVQGTMLQCYSRELDEWQAVWVDNMGAMISYYTGGHTEDGKTVMTGEDIWEGQKFLTRITTWNETGETFDWMMEHSYDGGETWHVSANAKYVKQI